MSRANQNIIRPYEPQTVASTEQTDSASNGYSQSIAPLGNSRTSLSEKISSLSPIEEGFQTQGRMISPPSFRAPSDMSVMLEGARCRVIDESIQPMHNGAREKSPSSLLSLLKACHGDPSSLAPDHPLARMSAVAGLTRYGLNPTTAATLDVYAAIAERPYRPISDHLPVSYLVQLDQGRCVKIASWNLLSEAHHANNYLNISIAPLKCDDRLLEETDYFNGKYHTVKACWLLYDFAEALAQGSAFNAENPEAANNKHELLMGTRQGIALLKHFLKYEYPNSDAATLRVSSRKTPEVMMQARKQAREAISMHLFASGDIDPEALVMLVQAHKMHKSMNAPTGTIHWQNRREALASNKKLLQHLAGHDVLTFQECTDPRDLLRLLNSASTSKQFKILCYNTSVGDQGKDNCCILYDAQKWQLASSVKFGLSNNKKPAILAQLIPKENSVQKGQLENRSSSKKRVNSGALCVGSVHYPGNKPNWENLKFVKQQLQVLASKSNFSDVNYFIAGDFNNTQAALVKHVTEASFPEAYVCSPKQGTMAGSDWDGRFRGLAIDHAITNLPAKASSVFPRWVSK